MSLNCPQCSRVMSDMLIWSLGAVVVQPDYLEKLRTIEHGGHVHVGQAYGLIPTRPVETKYAHVQFCKDCEMVCFCPSGLIPSEDVPSIAK